ncbi:MAG: hypothetical protein HY816_02785 [Candidatus Wallbacteria bacterium]|nr:hypothetical protein [Candidatus Wallbacteria bacterium]
MRSSTFRLLVMALGIGGIAQLAWAQEIDSQAMDEPGAYADASFPEQGGESEPVRIHRGMASPAEPSARKAPRRGRRQAAFDDDSGFRGRHTNAGPDPDLAREEMTRRSGDRQRAVRRSEQPDEVRHIDSEMDNLDRSIGMQPTSAAGLTVRNAAPESQREAPMRQSWKRTGATRQRKHKMAPFSDDPSGDQEQASSHRDPRHAYRPRPTADGESEERPEPRAKARQTEIDSSEEQPASREERPARSRFAPRPSRRSAAAAEEPADSASSAPSPAVELLSLQKKLTLMRRKNASTADMEALESRAAQLRSGWHKNVQAELGAPAARPSRQAEAAPEEPSEPSGAPFWNRDSRPSVSESTARPDELESESDEQPAPRRYSRPRHM